MLEEIEAERDKGRIRGPFMAPIKWGLEAVGPHQYAGAAHDELLPRPRDDMCYAAMAFPIEQIWSDSNPKVRRAEDWKRSGHNVRAHTKDKPVHYAVDHHVEVVGRMAALGLPTPQTWGQDHEGAYRQLPGWPRSVMWMVLMTASGPTLWQHLVIVFGAKAAVWAYNRFGDAIMHLTRILLITVLLHYVDDYSGIDLHNLAQSNFDAFKDMSELFRTRLKRSKRHRQLRRTRASNCYLTKRCTQGKNTQVCHPVLGER